MYFDQIEAVACRFAESANDPRGTDKQRADHSQHAANLYKALAAEKKRAAKAKSGWRPPRDLRRICKFTGKLLP